MTQNRNESINSIVWSHCPKKLFYGMHRFMISTCDTVPQFNDNLRTEFNEGKRYQGIRIIKIFEFENRSNVKKCRNH